MTQDVEQRCTCCDLLVSMCAKRRPPKGVVLPPANMFTRLLARSDFGVWFRAQYPGFCERCGTAFDVDDEIRADGSSGWEGRCCDER